MLVSCLPTRDLTHDFMLRLLEGKTLCPRGGQRMQYGKRGGKTIDRPTPFDRRMMLDNDVIARFHLSLEICAVLCSCFAA